jgi:acyl-CoA synthetase (AMP-forming)/AMP-acid ligase II
MGTHAPMIGRARGLSHRGGGWPALQWAAMPSAHIDTFARDRLPPPQHLPRFVFDRVAVEFRSSLPRTETGKLQRFKLREGV